MVSRVSRLAVWIGVSLALPVFAAPDPGQVLRSSLTLLRDATRIRVRAQVMNDEVIGSGQKLQRTIESVVKIRRPDGLSAETTGDRYRRSLRYDGRVLALYDPDLKLYARFDPPPTIDATAAAVRERLGLDLPLSQLFAANAVDTVGKATRSAAYIGLHRIDGASCHHLAFTQDDIDWQIWIAAEGQPVPRKIVIDFKTRPGRPQYIALLSDWDLSAKFAPAEFQFVAPADASEIEFLPLEKK